MTVPYGVVVSSLNSQTSKPDCKKELFDLKRQIRNDSCNNRLTILTTCNEKKCDPTSKLDKNADYVKDTKV